MLTHTNVHVSIIKKLADTSISYIGKINLLRILI